MINTQLILDKIEAFSDESSNHLQDICDLLKENVPHYDWVGFYFMNDDLKELHIGPYAGKKTDHSTIKYGKGICGQVAISGEKFIVPDVNNEDNYLSCSIETKSEIVIPIKKEGKLIGQIDIDSHQTDPFSSEDEYLLDKICDFIVEKNWI